MDKKYRIAVITITMNDGYKFNEWCEHYKEYKDELYLHIIVDNHSTPEYLSRVKEYFKDSVIIERKTNGGCTIAYNEGIRYALQDKNVEFISLVGNDIKIEKGALSKCAEAIRRIDDVEMIAPTILDGWSTRVEDFGCKISEKITMVPYMYGRDYSELVEEINICETVTGGMNIASRKFYETVGLQDENLFMYSDEVDMGLRARACGFKMGALRDAKAWHEHINVSKKTNRRHPYSLYLIARNKVYLANKHFGFKRKWSEFFYFINSSIKRSILFAVTLRFVNIKEEWWQILGAYNGLCGNMKPNKYSHL